jgi:hypothetical protein
MKQFIHPELKKDEVFFTNSNTAGYESIPIVSKRRGVNSYDTEGNVIYHEDWFPVFISQKEIADARESLGFLRSEFRRKYSF